MFKEYIASLRAEFGGYNAAKLGRDLMAGLTVAAVALPLALAFGVSSGATAAAGLITAIVAGLVISLLSGASFQISGPTGAMSAILVSLVARYGMQGMFVASFLAGAILLVCGFLKVGKLVSVIPMPVITGFTSGIAIIIALGQVDNFFGVTSQGENAIAKLLSYGELGFSPNFHAVLLGCLVMAIMILWPARLNARFPASLLAIIVTTALTMFMGWEVPLVGEIPRSLLADNRLNLLALDWSTLGGLAAPAVSIAALGMIESLLCGACGARMKNERFNADMELVAQGIGNMLIPLFGGVPATAAIARTSVAIKSGSETRLTGIFHAVGLLASMFLLGGIMSQIPLSALAGVLMMTAWRMNEWETIRYIFSRRFKSASFKFLITMAATVVFDLTVAILIGVVFSILVIVVKLSDVEVNAARIDLDKVSGYEGMDPQKLKESVVVYISGPIFFGSLEKVKNFIEEHREATNIILSLRGVPMIDTSGVQAAEELCDQVMGEGKKILFASVQPKVYRMLERAGIVEKIGGDKFYWSVERVLADRKLFEKESQTV
jgi:SulP family sulfate permease